MTWYVKRERWQPCENGTRVSTCHHTPRCGPLRPGQPAREPPFGRTRTGWVGPIRSEAQADREVAAWTNPNPLLWGELGPWTAARHASTPAVRAEVRAWERQAKGYPGEVTR